MLRNFLPILFVRGTSENTFKTWKQIQGNFEKYQIGAILTGANYCRDKI